MSMIRVFRPRFRVVTCLRCGRDCPTAYRPDKFHVCEMRFDALVRVFEKVRVEYEKDC